MKYISLKYDRSKYTISTQWTWLTDIMVIGISSLVKRAWNIENIIENPWLLGLKEKYSTLTVFTHLDLFKFRKAEI